MANIQVTLAFNTENSEVVKSVSVDLDAAALAEKQAAAALAEYQQALQNIAASGKEFTAQQQAQESAMRQAQEQALAMNQETVSLGETLQEVFSGKMKESTGEIGVFGEALSALGPAGLAAGAALAVEVGVVYELAEAFKSSIEQFSEYSHQVEIIGIKTGFSTTAVQEYGFGLGALGEPIDATVRGMQLMNVAIEKGSPAFAALGLDVKALKDEDPQQAFNDVATAINGISNQVEKIALLKQIFGRAGADMLPFIENMQRAAEVADKMGIVIGKDDVEAGASFAMGTNELKETMGGLSNEFAAAVLHGTDFRSTVESMAPIVNLLGFGVRLVGADIQNMGRALSVFAAMPEVQVLMNVADKLTGGAVSAGMAPGPAALNASKVYASAADPATKALTDALAAAKAVATTEEQKYQVAVLASTDALAAQKLALDQQAEAFAKANAGNTAAIAAEQKLINLKKDALDAAEAVKEAGAAVSGFFEQLARSNETRLDVSLLGPDPDAINMKMGLIADQMEHLGGASGMTDQQLQATLANLEKMRDEGGDNAFGLQAMDEAMTEIMARAEDDGSAFVTLSGITQDLTKDQNDLTKAWDKYIKQQQSEAQKAANDTSRVWGGLAQDFKMASTTLTEFGASAGSIGVESMNALASGAEIVSKAAKDGGLSLQDMMSYAQAAGSMFQAGAQKGAGGILSSGLEGGEIGMSLGGPMGAAIGAGAGVLISGLGALFGSKPEYMQVADDLGSKLGAQVSDATAKAIAATESTDKVKRSVAEVLNVDKIITDVGLTNASFTMVGSLMKGIADGAVPAKQGMDELDKTFTQIQQDSPAAATAMIIQAKALNEQLTPAMQKAVDAANALEAAGSAQIAQGLGEILVNKDTMGNMSTTAVSGQWGQDAATFFVAGFQQEISQKGLVSALDSEHANFDKMWQTFANAGNTGALAILAPFQQMDTAIEGLDTSLKGMVTTTDGMDKVFQGLTQSGNMTTTSFGAFERNVSTTNDALTKAGIAGPNALMAIHGDLQDVITASEQYGIPIDAATQKLIDQSKAAGLAFKTDPIVALTGSINDLVTALDKAFGLTKNLGGAMSALPGSAPPGSSSTGTYTAPTAGGTSTTGGAPTWIGGANYMPPHLGVGGLVTQPTLALVGESGPELVLPMNAYPINLPQPLAAAASSLRSPTSSTPTSIVIQPQVTVNVVGGAKLTPEDHAAITKSVAAGVAGGSAAISKALEDRVKRMINGANSI